jgi:hypothetical protein
MAACGLNNTTHAIELRRQCGDGWLRASDQIVGGNSLRSLDTVDVER